ncbi:hypothetical protein FQZ97_836910 [compost metagenome]
MFRAQAQQAIQLGGQRWQAVTDAQRQEILGVLVAGACVQGLALQPGAYHPAGVGGLGAEVGEALVNVGDSHGVRILPPSPG